MLSGRCDVFVERTVDKLHKLEAFLRGYAKLIVELETERADVEAAFEVAS